MSVEYSAYLFFSSEDASLSDWAVQFQSHLTFVLKRLLKYEIQVALNLKTNKELKKTTDLEATLKESATLLLHTPVLASLMSNDPSFEKNINAYKQQILAISTTDSQKSASSQSEINEFSFSLVDSDTHTEYLLTPDNPKTESLYWQRITDLAYAVIERIKPAEEQKKKKDTGTKCVYLAETTSDQTHHRDIIKWELEKYGYYIYPDKPLPSDSKAATKSINEYLSKCILAIHILGDQYGEPLSGSELSLIEIQNKIAIDYINQSADKYILPRLLWIPPGLKPRDNKQTTFLENLQHVQEELVGGEIIQTPLEVLKTIIRSKLSETLDKLAGKQDKTTKQVYLIHESMANSSIDDIIKALKNKEINVITSLDITKQKNMVSAHRKALAIADGLLIYYNTNNPFWINSKLRDSIKAPGYGRNKPFDVKAVLLGDNGSLAEGPFTRDLLILKQQKNKHESTLEPFMKQILP